MDIQQILTDRHIVHIDPDILVGVSVFIGTRVPLQTLFDYLEGEEGLNEFLEDFPHLRTSALQVLETIARVMLDRGEILNARSAASSSASPGYNFPSARANIPDMTPMYNMGTQGGSNASGYIK